MKRTIVLNVAWVIFMIGFTMLILSFNKKADPNCGFSDREIAEFTTRYNYNWSDLDDVKVEIKGVKGEGFNKELTYAVYVNGNLKHWTTSNASFYANKMKMMKQIVRWP